MARAAGIAARPGRTSTTCPRVTPLLARVYPNGSEDVNALPRRRRHGLRSCASCSTPGLVHEDVRTVAGHGPARSTSASRSSTDGALVWRDGRRAEPGRRTILRPADDPFDAEGGIRMLTGGLGRAVIKASAVKPEHQLVEAPALVLRRPGGAAGRLQARRARPRLRRRGPLPGPPRQRHARAAQPDPDAGRCCRTAAARSPWSPTGACPAPRARCRPPST